MTNVPPGEPAPKKQGKAAPWKPGQSGNPAGRPKGSRNQIAELFLQELQISFAARGTEAIQRMIDERPHEYVKVVASLLPKEFHIKDEALDKMGDEELIGLIRSIRASRARPTGATVVEGTAAAGGVKEPDSIH